MSNNIFVKKTLSSSYTPPLLAPYQSADCIICDGQGGVKVIDHVANKTLKSFKVIKFSGKMVNATDFVWLQGSGEWWSDGQQAYIN